MTYWRLDKLKEALEKLDGFEPSTNYDEGNLLDKNFGKWGKEIHPKQEDDWRRTQKLIRALKLGRKELGYMWYWCACKFNWRGWAIPWGLAFKMEAQTKVRNE